MDCTISFTLDTSHKHKKHDGKCRFYIRVVIGGKAKEYKTDFFMHMRYWKPVEEGRKTMRIVHSNSDRRRKIMEDKLCALVEDYRKVAEDLNKFRRGWSFLEFENRLGLGTAPTLETIIEGKIGDGKSKGLSEGTTDNLGKMKRHVSLYRPDTLVTAVDYHWLEGFYQFLAFEYAYKGKVGLAQNTLRREFKSLYECMKRAKRDGFIHTNPVEAFYEENRSKLKRVKPNRDKLTKEEIRVLHEAYVSERYKTTPLRNKKGTAIAYQGEHTVHKRLQIFLVGLYTGLRHSDLCQLSQPHLIHDGFLHLSQVKTKHVVAIPITDHLKEVMGQTAILDGEVPCGVTMRKTMNRILEDLGIQKYLTCHDLRRTFGTTSLAEGADLYHTSKLMGHRSTKTTEGYVEPSKVRLREAAKMLGASPTTPPAELIKEYIRANPELLAQLLAEMVKSA